MRRAGRGRSIARPRGGAARGPWRPERGDLSVDSAAKSRTMRRFGSGRAIARSVSKTSTNHGGEGTTMATGAPSKSEVFGHVCKDTGLSRKQVVAVFESLNGIIKKSLRGPGLFTLPGLLKMKVVKKPATKAREGINPFTKEKMIFKAKPASKKVRVLPLKSLKALVN